MSKLAIVATIEIVPGKRDKYLTFLKAHIRRTEPVRDASFGWRAAFLPLTHTVLFYSLHPDRELV